ncbi:Protein lifeguard 1 [Folsomia candida]|uniref:Protein lifeguard 1 n=1 Tax=Folsomia candida TaxID=158441 RepID=A0A226EHD5_FOLCA|nr:Protein lifeguard 1 [Folsomia candida]
MSFFSSPSKYLQQALEARRARQREEARKRRHNAQERARHPFIGNSHANHQTGGQIQFTSKWRSMSEFIPSIFTPRDLKTDTDLPGHVHDLHGGSSSIVDSSAELKVSSVGFDDDSVRLKNDPSRETQTEQRMESQIGPPELCLVGDESLNGSTSRHRREIDQEIDLLPFGLPEVIPSEPIVLSDQSDCMGPFRCHRYTVSYKLTTNCHRQSRFMKRVMLVLSIQYALLILWVAVVMSISSLSKYIVRNFNYSYLPLAIFAVSKILLRSTVKIRKLESWILITISFVRFACIAYYCGAVAVFAETDIILLTSIFLFLSHVFFTVTPHFVDYDVRSSEIVGMSAVVNLMFSLLLALPFTINKYDTSTLFSILVVNWLPSFLASQVIIMFLIFDLKQVMTGWRYPLGEADWIFTVLYL